MTKKLCLVTIFLMISIASAQVCTSNHWNCWNEVVKNNNGQRPQPRSYTVGTKTGVLGVISWNRRTTNLNDRSNQYTFQLNQNSACYIKCGP